MDFAKPSEAPLIARIDSPCDECGEKIAAGTRIIETAQGWAHAACPTPKPAEVCMTCFIEKAVNGACGCES